MVKKSILFLLGILIIISCFIFEMINNKNSIIKYELKTSEYYENNLVDNKYYVDDEYELDIFYDLYSDRLNIKPEIFEKYDLFIEVREASSGSISYELEEVKIFGDNVEFIIKENSPEVGTDDMAFWYFVAQIPKGQVRILDNSEWVKPSSIYIDKEEYENYDKYEFKLDSNNKYVIVTDYKWRTMMNDGGSHTSIYYNIDLDSNVVQKVRESYNANLGGIPKTTTNILYTVNINSSIEYDFRELLENEIILGEPSSNNYNFYTISSIDGNKIVYNLDTIRNIDNILNNIDLLK